MAQLREQLEQEHTTNRHEEQRVRLVAAVFHKPAFCRPHVCLVTKWPARLTLGHLGEVQGLQEPP